MSESDEIEVENGKMVRRNYSKIKQDEDIQSNSANVGQVNVPILNDGESRCIKFFHIIRSLKIEPVMLLFMFSFVTNTTCLTNMIMDKGCLFYFNFSEEVCKNLSEHKEERDQVEILANNYNLYLNLLTPISAIVVIFISPWSDKYGRKPPLLLALLGFFLNDVGIVLCSVYFDSGLEYILISNLPSQITGGFIGVMAMIYSHSAEASSTSSRSLKYTFLQIAFGVAVTLGAFSGGQLYERYGYEAVFITVASGHFVALLWVLLVVPETRSLENASFQQKFRDLCSIDNFINGFKSCIKRRENSGRLQLWLLLSSSCTIALTYEVYTNIAYVYAHHMYGWDPTMYSLMWTIFSFSEMVIFLTCAPILIKVFKLSDPLIGIIGTVSMIGKNVFLAMAYQLWLYYLSNIFGFLNGLGNLAIRSRISKIVDEGESGRVFSFLATCEAIIPLLGSAIIAKIFNATIKTFPGMCYIAASLFLIVPLGTFSFLWISCEHCSSINL